MFLLCCQYFEEINICQRNIKEFFLFQVKKGYLLECTHIISLFAKFPFIAHLLKAVWILTNFDEIALAIDFL